MIARLASGAWPAALCMAVLTSSSCAPKVIPLPKGPGSPFPEFAAAYAQATDHCRDLRSLSAELGLSGRAGRTRLRGRVLAGFAVPAQARLEGFYAGQPIFILVARGDSATLLLNREGRVLRGEKPDAIVDALAGVPLGPDDLRTAVAGCGFGAKDAAAGQSYGNDWAATDAGGAVTWLHRVNGRWRLAAAVRGPIEIQYDGFADGAPSIVHLRTPAEGSKADVTIRVSQLETNVELRGEAFQVEVPADAVPITLDELRRSSRVGSGEPPSSMNPAAMCDRATTER